MDDARLASEMTLDGIARQLEAIRADINGVKGQIGGLKGQIGGLEGEVGGLKGEIGGLKGEIGGLKGEIGGLKGEMAGMKAEIGGLKEEMAGVKGQIGGLNGEMAGMKAELKRDIRSLDSRMEQGFRRVDEELNAARIRDEEAHRFLKFGLEAREALRETMEARFYATDTKHAQEIDLLKDVLRAVSGDR